MQDHGRGRKADVGLDGEASWRIRILATSAIPKRRKGKTSGVASNRWQIYEAQLGPIVRAAAWLRLNVCLWHIVGRDGRIPSLLSNSESRCRTSANEPNRTSRVWVRYRC